MNSVLDCHKKLPRALQTIFLRWPKVFGRLVLRRWVLNIMGKQLNSTIFHFFLLYLNSYEPELFPGLIYRMVKPRVVLLIFVSGKVVLTGEF